MSHLLEYVLIDSSIYLLHEMRTFSGLLTYNDCAIIHWFIGGNVKCDVGPCHLTVGDNL